MTKLAIFIGFMISTIAGWILAKAILTANEITYISLGIMTGIIFLYVNVDELKESTKA